MDETDSAHAEPPLLRRVIAQSVVARLVSDTGTQLFNPFLPIFAAGLRTNVIALGWLVSARSLMGLLAPMFGAFGDRHGYRKTMRFGLLAGASGSLLVGVANGLLLAGVGMVVWGIGLAAFIPSLQAYLSAKLPYEKRARGIGIVEYAWALAGIVGLFTMGWLIDVWSWRVPFFVLAAGMAIMAIVVGRFPETASRYLTKSSRRVRFDPLPKQRLSVLKRAQEFFALGNNSRSAYADMIGSAFVMFAAMQLFIAHGAWLEEQYGLGPSQLGMVAVVLGLFDLCGSGSVSLFVDRFGKKRSVLLGCGMALFGYAVLPFVNVTLVGAVTGIAVARGSFEFAIVSNIALLSEQVPEERGKVLTLGSSANLVGMTLAGTTGPWLYTEFGVMGLSVVSALTTAVGAIMIAVLVNDRHGSKIAKV